MNSIEIGERLKIAIKQSKYSQKELSAILQISEDSITRYIKQKQSPKIDTLLEICNVLNISIIWLLTGEENKTTSLTPNEQELLTLFKELPEREQIKVIGIVEDRLKSQPENEKSLNSKIG